MTYSITDFAKSLKVANCKIRNGPGLLFLCGGPIDSADKPGEFRSARDFFYRHLLKEKQAWKSRIKLAEEVNAWFQKDWLEGEPAFRDLLELENYLANLAAVTVLFVESPGSIAELGAFAASDELRPKTLAVLNTAYGSDKSFIADGPVRRIKGRNEKHVQYYEWDPKNLNDPRRGFREIAQALTASLEQEEAERQKLLRFDREKPSHTLLLVTDLIRIAGVASKADIEDCLDVLGCKSARDALDKHLSILQSVGFIEKRLRSNETFYVNKFSTAFIRYAYISGIRDATRSQFVIRQSLEPNRRAVYRDSLKKVGSNV